MGRIARISKEDILSAGVRIIVRDGYSSVTVKSLAKEAGCSTQPILWYFKDMETCRKELAKFAFQYLQNKMNLPTDSAMMAFGFIGLAWLDTAIDEPNLLSYLLSTDLFDKEDCGISKVLSQDESDVLAQAIANQLDCSVNDVNRIMMTLELFTVGMMDVIIKKSVTITKEQAHILLRDVAITQMIGIGVDPTKAKNFLNNKKVK